MADEARLYEALRRFARTMTGDYDLAEVLYRLTDEVSEVLGVVGAGIAVTDDHGRLRYATSSDDRVAALERVQEEHQVGPCVEAYRTQEPVMIDDIAEGPEWVPYRSTALDLGFRGVAGIPLSLATERFGALNVYHDEPRRWTGEEVARARVLADMAAGYLVQARLDDSRRLAEQLQAALDARVVIEQAKGILSAEYRITVDEAFDVLRAHARRNNLNLRRLAEETVNEGFRPPRPD